MSNEVTFEEILQDSGLKDLLANSQLLDQLKKLALDCAIAGADAALDYLEQNIKNVDFGALSSIIQTLVSLGVREAKKLLHQGLVVI